MELRGWISGISVLNTPDVITVRCFKLVDIITQVVQKFLLYRTM